MSEQPVEDPVQHASSTLTGYAYAALTAADLLGQARLRQAHTARIHEQHSQRAARLVPAARLAEARARWAPLLDPDLRSRLHPGDLAAAEQAAAAWRAHRATNRRPAAIAIAVPADHPRLLPAAGTAVGRGQAALPAVHSLPRLGELPSDLGLGPAVDDATALLSSVVGIAEGAS